jgi:uncharacterized protein YdeI (YjbR/CyaY-like superfamily)
MFSPVQPTFFKSLELFESWLESHHSSHRELLVGFHKLASGKPSITYPEALDAALCYGWIDGIRKSLDATSYTIRFTPRKRDSIWSAVNLRHVARLKAAGLMQPSGLKVFHARDREKAKLYSYENRQRPLGADYARRFKANRTAWTWFETQSASYRRLAAWWVMSAKREETRTRRLAALISSSAKGTKAPPFILGPKDRVPEGRS